MGDKKTCDTCFWASQDGYCTEGGRPPRQYSEICDKYAPVTGKYGK